MCLESISGNPPKVIQHFCSCKAGQGACNHKVALLYQAAHYSMLNLKTVPVIPSKTSVPQEWHKPRTAGVSTECSQDIHVRKPKFKSNIGESGPLMELRAASTILLLQISHQRSLLKIFNQK